MHIGDEIVCRGVIVGYSRNSGGLIRVDFPAHKNVSIYRDMITEVVPPPWKPAVGDRYHTKNDPKHMHEIVYIGSDWILVQSDNLPRPVTVAARDFCKDRVRI